MKRSILFCVLTGILAAGPAQASFDLWLVSEVYSNADGSVQFVEFSTAADGQQFLINQQLQALTEGFPETIYTFPTSLVVGSGESTADRHFLFASPGFESVAGIAPDYEWTGIYPFIHLGLNDLITLLGADSIGLANLPTDGAHSLLGDEATIAVPTPTNFAGETGTLPEAGTSALGVVASACLAALAARRKRQNGLR
jgi:hypothetical protein